MSKSFQKGLAHFFELICYGQSLPAALAIARVRFAPS